MKLDVRAASWAALCTTPGERKNSESEFAVERTDYSRRLIPKMTEALMSMFVASHKSGKLSQAILEAVSTLLVQQGLLEHLL